MKLRKHHKDARRTSQAGMSLVEVSVGMALSVLIVGALVSMQGTAVNGFKSSLDEREQTNSLRRGIQSVRTQIRAARIDSFNVDATAAAGDSMLSFQEAVDFDVDSGNSIWGADGTVEASVEYYVADGQFCRRTRLEDGSIEAGSTEVVIKGLAQDMAEPVQMSWDSVRRTMTIAIFVEAPNNRGGQARKVETKVNVAPVFDF